MGEFTRSLKDIPHTEVLKNSGQESEKQHLKKNTNKPTLKKKSSEYFSTSEIGIMKSEAFHFRIHFYL